MRIELDAETCISSGECCYNHPALFRFGDDDVPVVLVGELTTDQQRVAAAQAAEVCPSGAITVTA